MDNIIDKIENKAAICAVIGLGYVGIPLLLSLLESGYQVNGIDTNKEYLERLKNGVTTISEVKNETLMKYLGETLYLYADYKEIAKSDVLIICVPTPLTKEKKPDLIYITDCMNEIACYIKKNTVIILESTTYPGTTEELIADKIIKEKGWQVGKEFYVCYSPERIDPGNKEYTVVNTPKIMAGITKECVIVGKLLYSKFINEIVEVSSTQVAELSKLLENTFRCVNIALVNEMMMIAERMNINIWETIEAAATKPYGFMKFTPGPGVGGHCIPLDPIYLEWKARQYNYYSRFIETSMDINNNMPYYIVNQIRELLQIQQNKITNPKIMLIGVTYKRNSSDLRESPALLLYTLLTQNKFQVVFYDPYIESFELQNETIYRTELTQEIIKSQDVIVIVTDHSCIDYKMIQQNASLIYDTRNVYKTSKSREIYYLGEPIVKKDK